jgi:Flp pilus assembly protein TadG
MSSLNSANRRAPRFLLVRRIMRERAGTAAVEFSLIMPALLLLLLGIMEFGRAMWVQNALHYSVQQAARCASIDANTCGSSSQTTAFAAQQAGAGFTTAVFTVATPSCGNQVSASYPIQLHIPFLDYALTLTAQSCYPK